MNEYALTVFSKSGEKLLDEIIEAENNDVAKQIGRERLVASGYAEHTHRLVSSDAALILFHQ